MKAMKRRGFLGAILAAATAPAFVQSGILMPVKKIVDPWSAERVGELMQQAWEEARCWEGPDRGHFIDAIRYGMYDPGHTHSMYDPWHNHGDALRSLPAHSTNDPSHGHFLRYGAGALPIGPGTILAFPGNRPLPAGWLECDGLHARAIMRSYGGNT